MTFGAVARSRNQNFTIGEGKPFDGTRARTTEQLAALNKYSDRLRDYCHSGDPICAVGSTPVDVGQHLDYFIRHNEEVLKWVTEKAKGTSGKVSDGNTASKPSTSTILPSTQQSSTPAQTSNTPTPSTLPYIIRNPIQP